MIRSYFLMDEVTEECDWKLYRPDELECKNTATYALVDQEEFDPDTGMFHVAHLCEKHGPIVFEEITKP